MANSKKRRDVLDKIYREYEKNYEKNKCDCYHMTKNGELELVPKKNREAGKLDYVCTDCNKDVRMNRVTPEAQDAAVENIDSMCDVIKMSLDRNSEKDQDIHRIVAQTQFFIRNNLKKLYQGAIQRSGNGKNRRRNKNRNEEDSGWITPGRR